jgi:hypothetical protein
MDPHPIPALLAGDWRAGAWRAEVSFVPKALSNNSLYLLFIKV